MRYYLVRKIKMKKLHFEISHMIRKTPICNYRNLLVDSSLKSSIRKSAGPNLRRHYYANE